MTIRRAIPNVVSRHPFESRPFYEGLLGFELAMDLGWITTYVAPGSPEVQISVLSHDAGAPVVPQISIEVSDVDELHARALDHSAPVVYPLTDERWGVRRFFLRDPNGVIVNLVSHR